MLHPGDITAYFAASVRKTPAEAALAPAGETKTMVSFSERRISCTMFLVESSSPPGVSRIIIIESKSSSLRSLKPLEIYLSVTGVIASFTVKIKIFFSRHMTLDVKIKIAKSK